MEVPVRGDEQSDVACACFVYFSDMWGAKFATILCSFWVLVVAKTASKKLVSKSCVFRDPHNRYWLTTWRLPGRDFREGKPSLKAL